MAETQQISHGQIDVWNEQIAYILFIPFVGNVLLFMPTKTEKCSKSQGWINCSLDVSDMSAVSKSHTSASGSSHWAIAFPLLLITLKIGSLSILRWFQERVSTWGPRKKKKKKEFYLTWTLYYSRVTFCWSPKKPMAKSGSKQNKTRRVAVTRNPWRKGNLDGSQTQLMSEGAVWFLSVPSLMKPL